MSARGVSGSPGSAGSANAFSATWSLNAASSARLMVASCCMVVAKICAVLMGHFPLFYSVQFVCSVRPLSPFIVSDVCRCALRNFLVDTVHCPVSGIPDWLVERIAPTVHRTTLGGVHCPVGRCPVRGPLWDR